MKKRKIIAITGNIAGGKSIVVNKIAKKLGMDTYFASQRFRELARTHNMDIATFNAFIEENPEIDKAIDNAMAEYLKKHDNLVVDSRLAWFFEKDAFKVFISVDLETAAKRLAFDSKNRNVEDKYSTIDEAKVAIIKRQNYEKDRYKKEYGIDVLDYSNYDLVIDSTNLSTEEMTKMIIEEYNEWLSKDRD